MTDTAPVADPAPEAAHPDSFESKVKALIEEHVAKLEGIFESFDWASVIKDALAKIASGI